MSKKDGTPEGGPGMSGIEYIKFVVSGQNRFVKSIALPAAPGGLG